MPRKGKKSQASKVRWQKFGESQLSTPAEQVVNSFSHSNRQVNVPEPSHANVTRVLASRSQMHHKYADSNISQCACNSVTFLAFLHELQNLQSSDLDLVLDRGHAMYALILSQLEADGRKVHSHLNVDEIPEIVFGYRQQHVITKCDSVVGLFTASTSEGDHPNLVTRLQCLSSEVNHALLIMSSVCIAVFRDRQGRYGFFDPHSRRPDGLPHGIFGTGTAVMFIFTHLSDLIAKVVTSFRTLGTSKDAQYELMPLVFHSVDELTVDENLTHVDSNADVAVSHTSEEDHHTMSSNMQAGIESTLPSWSVSGFTPCADITSDPNGLMHVSSSTGVVVLHTADIPKCNNQNMPIICNLSKLSKQDKKKCKRRVMDLGKKNHTHGKKAAKNRRTKIQKLQRNGKEREKYCRDSFFKEQKKSQAAKCHLKNPACRERKMSYITTHYREDPNF